MAKNIDDILTWKMFKNGDVKSFNSIFYDNYKSLFSYGLKIIANEELVKDSIQDLFFKIWNNRSNLMDVSDIKIYLLKSLRNLIFDKLKSSVKWILKERIPEDYFEVEFSYEDFLISEQFDIEQAKTISSALNKLTKRQREAIYLKYYENQDFEKISEIMSLNVQSVRNLIHDGIKMLKEYFRIIILWTIPFFWSTF